MAEKLTVSASKKAIFERLVHLIGSGQTLGAASALIESETGQKCGTTKAQFYRQGGFEALTALTSGVAMKAHGNRKLTDRQEAKMRAVLVELSKQDGNVTAGVLMKHVERLFGVSVSRGWTSRFLQGDTTKKKAKLPAKKRAKTKGQDSVLVGDHQGASKRARRADKDEELESLSQVAEKAATEEEIQNCRNTHANRDEEGESLRIQLENLTRRNEELEALLKRMIGIADYAVKKANSLEEKKTREDVDNSGEAILEEHSF